VNGLRLADMEVSEMLDVIHYFFEEDYRYTSTDQADFKDNFRDVIYKNLYNVEYTYKTKNSQDQDAQYKDFDEQPQDSENSVEEEPLEPFSPRKKQIKNFIEPSLPTEHSTRPFGLILDEPIA
jgi:hypothetical protein